MNGIVVVNKPRDYTSRDVVNVLTKIFNTKKVGHTGTLDPLAEGVLVCPVGKCTKLCEILTCETKEYIAEATLGIETDTLDITGNILKQSANKPSKEDLIKALNHFKTTYLQEVPLYSSIKIKGKKLYEYARNKIDIELPKRLVTIKNIELLEYKENTFKFKVLVSKGTYIRSLIRDIGLYLNTYATMSSLIRTKQGEFNLENSFTLEEIKKGTYQLISLEEAFSNYPNIEVNKEQYKQIQNGQMFPNTFKTDYLLFSYQGNVIALYVVNKKDKNKIKPLILV